ncbi:MAG: HAD hydrolase-like protein [Bacteroidota bacterium]
MILVIFDVDGTLVQSNKADSRCFAATYHEVYGRPFPTIDWRKYPHVSDTTIFKTVIEEHFNRTPSAEEEEAFRQQFVANIIEKRKQTPDVFQSIPYAKEAIDKLLKDARFVVGIATGGWKAPAIVKLNFVNIPVEELIITGADGKITRAEIINETIDLAKQQHGNFQHIVYVGDAIWDFTTTLEMGLPLIGIRWRGDLDFFHRLGVPQVLEDYKDYDQFLSYCLQPFFPKAAEII